MNRAVFLDRDGVINKVRLVNGRPHPPSNMEDVEILDGVIESIALLKAKNFTLVVITNQPDVARGETTQLRVDEINSFIGSSLGLKYFYVCSHDNDDNCECRKPAPGLILRAASELEIDISKSYFVGDRWRDIAASQAAGCRAFFIDYSYIEQQPQMPFTRVSSLFEAVQLIAGD
jgi:D-glycero-D-manno-heptose 1,7-bisphosphate phosphatase